MAILNSGNLSQSFIVQRAIDILKQHRAILSQLNDYYSWSSGITAADLEGPPFNLDAATANGLLSAIADAHAEYLIHTTGQAPATYPQVTGTPYQYHASQDALIGPNVGV